MYDLLLVCPAARPHRRSTFVCISITFDRLLYYNTVQVYNGSHVTVQARVLCRRYMYCIYTPFCLLNSTMNELTYVETTPLHDTLATRLGTTVYGLEGPQSSVPQ